MNAPANVLLAALLTACGPTFDTPPAPPAEHDDPPVELLPLGATTLELPASSNTSGACGAVTHRLAVPEGTCAVVSVTSGTSQAVMLDGGACDDLAACAVFQAGELLTVAGDGATEGSARVWVEEFGASGECERRCGP
jgi:hypothetical protein